MTPEQFNALIAAGMTGPAIAANIASIPALFAAGMQPAQIAAAFSGAAAPAQTAVGGGNSTLSALKNAPDPRNQVQGLSHPENTPLVNGRGMFDGEYAVTIDAITMEKTKKGQIFKVVFVIDESSHPGVLEGTKREHPLYQWVDAAISETKGLLQILSDACGRIGPWDDAFYYDATGEKQCCKGLRFQVSVFTEPQRKNAAKFFTKHRYSRIANGQSLGLVAAAAPVAAAPAATVVNPLAGLVQAAAPAAVAGVTIPTGWPKNAALQYPGSTPEQWAAYMAAA